MQPVIKRPNGTADILPQDMNKWHTAEKIAADTASGFGFREIRIPTFEVPELFSRGVGDTTDIVQKEMYRVTAKDTEFVLRPEGTAGTVRAVLQNGLLNGAMPLKLFYILSCFRHERPQAGRLREFHQFGLEMFGAKSASADAEVIMLVSSILERLELKNIRLKINSIGCRICREEYYEQLRAYFTPHKEHLCETCLTRLEKNPMRILDCKSPECREIAENAPVILDFLCDECRGHFSDLKASLTDIEYETDTKIVRGLDYYTKTVFEFVTDSIGAQGTVCGGGRYDGLVSQLGGAQTPALGFAMGLERLIMTMESQGCEFIKTPECDLYIVNAGAEVMGKVIFLANQLRQDGHRVEYDLMGRSMKAQMKYADKLGAAFVTVIGEDEIKSGQAKLKHMSDGKEFPVSIDSSLPETFMNIILSNVLF